MEFQPVSHRDLIIVTLRCEMCWVSQVLQGFGTQMAFPVKKDAKRKAAATDMAVPSKFGVS